MSKNLIKGFYLLVLNEIKRRKDDKVVGNNKGYTAANWDKPEDSFTQTFFSQNTSQFWLSEEIGLAPDLNVWHSLPKTVQDTYAKNLMTLTFLDTAQGDLGMNTLSRSMKDSEHQRKALLNFMAAMENAVHAKSYSSIFMTYMDSKRIEEIFEWGENDKYLQGIVEIITKNYKSLEHFIYAKEFGGLIDGKEVTEEDYKVAQWKFMVTSTFLETYLFYSGFYYPLYFYGQGKLMQAGEIINLILRDEQVHGLYVGMLAQEIYQEFELEKQETLAKWMYNLLNELYVLHKGLIEELYNEVDLTHDVKKFVRYNANKALMNLGFDPYFEYEEVNPVIVNGLNTTTKTMDFFSMKGNGYQKMTSIELVDDDFAFDGERTALI